MEYEGSYYAPVETLGKVLYTPVETLGKVLYTPVDE